jgi:hypothetical protein
MALTKVMAGVGGYPESLNGIFQNQRHVVWVSAFRNDA